MGQAIFVAVITGVILLILRQVWKRWTAPYQAHSMQDFPPGVQENEVSWTLAHQRTADRFRHQPLRYREWHFTGSTGDKFVLVRNPSRSE